jgi:hypothetical protein
VYRVAKRRGQHVRASAQAHPHKIGHARQLIADGTETQAAGLGVATLRRAGLARKSHNLESRLSGRCLSKTPRF